MWRSLDSEHCWQRSSLEAFDQALVAFGSLVSGRHVVAVSDEEGVHCVPDFSREVAEAEWALLVHCRFPRARCHWTALIVLLLSARWLSSSSQGGVL